MMVLVAMFAACLIDPLLWLVVAVGLALGARRKLWGMAILAVVGAFVVTEVVFLMKASFTAEEFLLSWAIRTAAAGAIVGVQLQLMKWWAARKARKAGEQ